VRHGASRGLPRPPIIPAVSNRSNEPFPSFHDGARGYVDSQVQAIDTVLYLPLGQFFQPTAYRSDIFGYLRSPLAIFWNVGRS